MAITNRHEYPKYIIKEHQLTTEQRKDFAEKANQADRRRQIQNIMRLSQQKIKVKNKRLTKKKSRVREVVWSLVFGVSCLWVMYMFG